MYNMQAGQDKKWTSNIQIWMDCSEAKGRYTEYDSE